MKFGARIRTTRKALKENYWRLFYTHHENALKQLMNLFQKEPLFQVIGTYGVDFAVYDCGYFGVCFGNRFKIKDLIEIPESFIDDCLKTANNPQVKNLALMQFESGLRNFFEN